MSSSYSTFATVANTTNQWSINSDGLWNTNLIATYNALLLSSQKYFELVSKNSLSFQYLLDVPLFANPRIKRENSGPGTMYA